jgi:hypothetical protein
VQRQEWLESLSPEELESVRSYAWEKLLRARKVKVDGKVRNFYQLIFSKLFFLFLRSSFTPALIFFSLLHFLQQISMRALIEDVRKRQEEFDRGLYDEDVRTISRAQSQELVPSSQLRPGSYKQILREEEEESLALQRLGNGNSFASKKGLFGVHLPWQRNFAYGIFGRPDRVQKYMGSSWASESPDAVLDDQALYNDILRRCNQLELTLMLLTSRPLKIQQVRPAVEGVLRQGMERLSGSTPLKEEESTALKNFVRQIDGKLLLNSFSFYSLNFFPVSANLTFFLFLIIAESRLRNTGFVQNGTITKGTHFIFSADPKGGLTAEAITPGTISERKTSFIGSTQNPLLTAAVFDAFIGPHAQDPVGKRQIGRGVLWAARGLPFKPQRGKDFSVGFLGENGRMDLSSQVHHEELVASTKLFKLDLGSGVEKPRRMLLNKIALAR